MVIKKIAFLFFLSLAIISLTAQDKHLDIQINSKKAQPKNGIGLFIGNTSIVQSGFYLPTVGIEYFRELNHFVAIGVISEFELGSHIVQKSEENAVISEVNRESAILILPTLCFRVYKGLLFKVGYGVEFEKSHDLGLLKVGFDYVLFLKDPKWRVLPGVSWDHTKYFDGVVYGVTFAYTF